MFPEALAALGQYSQFENCALLARKYLNMEKIMMNNFNKSLVLSAAMAAPLLLGTPAMASTGSSLVNQNAVDQFTSSVQQTLSAYDTYNQGNTVLAKAKLEKAIRNLENAMSKDPTLGFSSKSGTEFRNELKTINAKFNTQDRSQVRADLSEVLSSIGVISAS